MQASLSPEGLSFKVMKNNLFNSNN